jgi:hypothetical protein
MATIHMPIRGERSAPLFDQKEPSELGRFFKQLKTLFARCTIINDKEKKEYATSYVKSNVADSWEALTEFTSEQKSYQDFKDRLYELYNQSSLRYILADLDRLVGERQRIGMRSLQDISEFHLQFITISTYLLANSLVSSRCYGWTSSSVEDVDGSRKWVSRRECRRCSGLVVGKAWLQRLALRPCKVECLTSEERDVSDVDHRR